MATAEADIGVGSVRPVEGAQAVRALTSTPFLGVMLAVLTWPIASVVPATGPDASWAAGLYMAHAGGLQFGREIVFTYGPLGFLQVPALYDQAMWILAFLFQAAVHVALAVSLLWVARRAFPLALAVALCYGLLVIGGLGAGAVLLAFVWCFVALGDRPPPFVVPLVTIGGGALAAVELLAKANYGVAILFFGALATLGVPARRRSAPLFAAIVAGGLAASWLAAGQDLSALPDFVSRSTQVVSGYSAAMGTDIVASAWERVAAVAAMALLLAATTVASWRDPAPRRIASIGLVALFSFMSFKQAFVRQGLGNTPEFFVLMAAAGMVVASRLPRRFFRGAALLTVAPLAVLALIAVPGSSPWHALKPEPHVEFIRKDLDALLRPGERRRLISEARRSMRAGYGIDPAILAALRGRTVHIDPWEIGAAWAYGLDWQPLPVMQSYSAYTPELDRLNAAALSAPSAPAAILRHRDAVAGIEEVSVDDRFPGWESPAAMRAMLCRYRAVRTTGRWQLLERGGDRCDPPRPIGLAHSTTGTPIPVPPPPDPRDLVFARIDGIGVEGWEAARSTLYRARERTVSLGARGTWRLVPATAGDGLIMRAPPALDYPPPFRLAPDASTISVRIEGVPQRALTVRFFAQRVRQPGGGEAEAPGRPRASLNPGRVAADSGLWPLP